MCQDPGTRKYFCVPKIRCSLQPSIPHDSVPASYVQMAPSLPSTRFPFHSKSGIGVGCVVSVVWLASYCHNLVDSSAKLIVTWRFVQFCTLAYVSDNAALLQFSVVAPPSQDQSFQTSNTQTKIALTVTGITEMLGSYANLYSISFPYHSIFWMKYSS